MGRRMEQPTGSTGSYGKSRVLSRHGIDPAGQGACPRPVAEFFVPGGLKYLRGVPIALLSKDNGGWQPVNANGQKVKALKNITLGKDAVKTKNPRRGVTHGRSQLW
jgi:hypothetical protein